MSSFARKVGDPGHRAVPAPAESELRDERDGARARSLAQGFRVDPRIPATVPGFDAPFFQAGLAGYSDRAMRLTARSLGAPYCVTESLLDHHLLTSPRIRAAETPLEDDKPLAGQIIGHDPAEMARAAGVAVEMGFSVIDVNLACPSKLVKRRERGGNLLSQPGRAIEILRAVRDAVPAEVPCTVKLRRAFDDSAEMAEAFDAVFEAAYDGGYAWATVHSRTVEQRYVGYGRWAALADLVRRYPDRLIFGSGDVETAEDIFSMLDLCGVHGVAVARGAITNPWIFRQARGLLAGEAPALPPLEEQGADLLLQFERRAELLGARRASILMRKQSIHIAETHPHHEEVRHAFIEAKGPEDWCAVVRRFFLEA